MNEPFLHIALIRKPLLLLLVLYPIAHATTYTVNASQSQSTIQAVINATAVGDSVVFSAGTYSVSSSYNLKCGVAYSGQRVVSSDPKALAPTAIMRATFSGGASIFTVPSGCIATETNPTQIEYFWCQNTGCVWGDGSRGNIAYLTIRYNKVTNLPSAVGGSDNHMVAFYFLGAITSNTFPGSGYITSNIDIEYNAIGDVNSCTAVFASSADNSGYCGGIAVYQWQIHDWTVKYNYFYHLEEPMHFEQIASFNNGAPEAISSCTGNCVVEYNYTYYTHRHALEIQFGMANDSFLIEHNVFESIYQSTNATFGTSLACCQEGTYQGDGASRAHNPADIYDDNVVIADLPSGPYWTAPMGLEWWGNGAQASNNLIEGNFGAGIEWGFLTTPPIASYNYLCGPYMANGGVMTPSGAGPYGYIISEGYNPSYTVVPAQIGNVTSPTCKATASVAPTISSTPSGARTSPIPVTLTMPVNMSAMPSGENTTIYYTTDGSSPTTSSAICNVQPAISCTFPVSPGTIVKAISMWGVLPQPKAYPSGYGYVPSGVVTASIVPTAATPVKLVSAYLKSKGGATTIELGRTLQFIAYGVYSDGSVEALPGPSGDKVTAWNTSNHAVAKISTLGHVTAMGVGTATIEGFVGNLEASTSEVTVTSAPASNLQATLVEPSSATHMEQSSGTVPAAPGSPIGDNFLGPLWKVVAPNSGSASISNGHLFLNVPGGSNHDTLLPSNQAVRVVQAIGNSDFDVSIKIDSKIEAGDADTSQGLMVLSDDDDLMTFALTTDGTNIGLAGLTISGGVSTTVFNDTDFSQYESPMYLRLARSGDAYMAFYSIDGAHWTQATSFTDARTFAFIGPFASNYDKSPADAVPVVMSVDWFHIE